MNRDHLAGGFRHLRGRAQTATGSVTGNLGRQAEGAVNQIVGGARYAYGDARDIYQDVRATAADAYDEIQARAASTVERGRDLVDDAARRGRDLRERTARIAGGDRTLGLLVAAGVGFALATLIGRRSA